MIVYGHVSIFEEDFIPNKLLSIFNPVEFPSLNVSCKMTKYGRKPFQVQLSTSSQYHCVAIPPFIITYYDTVVAIDYWMWQRETG